MNCARAKEVGRPLELEALEDRIAPAGVVIASVVNGALVVEGDALGNDIVIDAAGLAAGQVRVSTGVDSTTINGADAVILSGVTGNVVLNMGEGDVHVAFDGVAVAGKIAFNGEAGQNWLELQGGCVVGGMLAAKSAQTVGIADASVGGDVRITNGAGDSNITIDSLQTRSLAVKNGEGRDFFAASGVKLAGALGISNGAGDSVTAISNSSVLRVSVTNGTGDDGFSADGLTCTSTGAALKVSNGAGSSDAAVLASQFYGAVAMNSDLVDFDDTTVVKGITISGGAQRFHAGACTIGIDAMHDRRYNVKVSAGTMSLVELADVDLGGSLQVVFRPFSGLFTWGWPVYVDIGDSAIGGNVTVDSKTFGQASFAIEGSSVAGAVRIATLGGNDTIMVNDSSFSRPVTISTGWGEDTVAIETGALSDGPTSVFSSTLTLKAGNDDDIVTLGAAGQAGRHGDCLGAVILDGGEGNDTLTAVAGANTFAVEPLVNGFEVVIN